MKSYYPYTTMKKLPQLSAFDAVSNFFNKMFQIEGRSRRSEYWWTMAFIYLVDTFFTPAIGSILHLLALPLTLRRLHDAGHSGWWLAGGVIISIVTNLVLVFDLLFKLLNAFQEHSAGDLYLNLMISFMMRYLILIILTTLYALLLFFFLCADSEKTTNKYGPSPKYVEE